MHICNHTHIQVYIQKFINKLTYNYINTLYVYAVDVSEEVVHCFQVDDIEECKARLRKNTNSWSLGLAEKMDSIPQKLIQVSI